MLLRALQTVVWGGMDAVDNVKEGIDNLPHKVKERAERNARYMKEEFDEKNEELENQKVRSHEVASALGLLKYECAENIIPNALNIIEQHQRINRKLTEVTEDKLDTINSIKLPYLRNHFSEYSSTVFKGVSTGVTTVGSLYAIAGVYGTASTGTAISSLSGAAATNATVAWFGGGSLAAGGAGMTGGMVALGGIVALPVAVFAYMRYKENTEKEITALREYADEVNIEVEKIQAILDISIAMNEHILQYKETLQKLIGSLEDTISSISDGPDLNIKIAKSICLIRAIKDILKVSLFSSDESDNNIPDADCLAVMGISHNVITNFSSSDDDVRTVINKKYSVKEIADFSESELNEMSDVEFLWLSELHEQFNAWYDQYKLDKDRLKQQAEQKIRTREIAIKKSKKIKLISLIVTLLVGTTSYYSINNDDVGNTESSIDDLKFEYTEEFLADYLNSSLSDEEIKYDFKYSVDKMDDITFRITLNALCGSSGCDYMFAKIKEDGGLCYVDAASYEEAYSASTCSAAFF